MNHVTSTLAQSHWIPVAIFLATYILIAVESGRGSHLDRTAAAFCGAVAMVLVGAVPLPEAYQTIDWNTLIFLLGIMMLVAHFQISGFFDWIAVQWRELRGRVFSCWCCWSSPREFWRSFL